MIPVKLQLRNFMAYKTEANLDFSEIRTACLSGENGAGKSSILDAITWSLWGIARAGRKQMDELIHLGESEMEVSFSFNLDGGIYRVLRKRSAAGRGRSELHFHISDAGGWRTLTEGSMTQTQTKINRLLRLDYDTFINSAFLLQGRADEFTNKTPADRKQILADILGLGIYDEYESKARDQVRHYEQESKIIEGQISQMEAEMAREAEYRLELEEGQREAAKLKRSLGEIEQSLSDLRRQHQELAIKNQQLEELQDRVSQEEIDIADLAQSIAETEARLTSYQQTLGRQDEIEAGYEQLKAAQAEADSWAKKLQKSRPLLDNQHQLETAIASARSRLETDIKVAQTRVAELTPKAKAIPELQSELAAAESKLAELKALETERDENRLKANQFNAETARLKEENKQLKTEMERIKSRLTQLEEAESVCPVCHQPLSEEHRETVKQEFMSEGTAKGDAYRQNLAQLQETEDTLTTLENGLKQSDRQLKQLPALQSLQATKQHAFSEAQAAQETVQTVQASLTELQTQIAEGQFEVEAIAQLSGIKDELAKLGYDDQAHQTVQTQVEGLSHFAAELRQLEDAQTRLTESEARLKQDQTRKKRLEDQLKKDQETVAQLQAATETLPQIAAELTETSRTLDKLQRDENLARNAVIAAEQKLNIIARQATDRVRKEEQLTTLRETIGIYQELRTAFGKNGVQALLIEHTIPELENEANNILARMTDGRMHLQFITQKETKTGRNLVETLDIRIADEVGTRNYNLYSGGEAFRVNFAIRIALSKLLPRRSGARLQTLVIDEGFGTQDVQGRERLVEAINKIQDDFEKIVVITHIDELKDAFPTRITVQKDIDGSRIIVG